MTISGPLARDRQQIARASATPDELGRAGFDPGQPRVQQLPGAADANPWCQTLPSGTGFEAASASLVSCVVPTHHG